MKGKDNGIFGYICNYSNFNYQNPGKQGLKKEHLISYE